MRDHPTAPRPGAAFTLAHLSDAHLTSPGDARPGELANKRILGYLSWRWRRHRVHLPEILERLTADARARAPDHLVITGDLTHLGTPAECLRGLEWLRRCGDPETVTAIPGNHDRYTRAPWAPTVGLWHPYMSGDDGGTGFPFLRRRAGVALIGLSTARPTAPGLASGRLGARQLAALEPLLEATGRAGLFRVVLLHHPAVPGVVARRKGLDDAGALGEVLARRGAELVLHGHAHRSMRGALPGPGGPIPVLGVPSASSSEAGEARRAAYHLYRVTPTAGGWQLQVRCRVLGGTAPEIREARPWELELPLHPAPAGAGATVSA